MDNETSRQDLLGGILLERGYLSREQFEECRASYATARTAGVKATLLKVIRDKGFLNAEQTADVRRELVKRGVRPKLGDYELLDKIGSGGMGAVYRAKHPRLGTTVAVKVLLPHVASDKTLVERFAREARLAARIGSGIVHVMDVQKAGGRHFIVMEYVEGESVEERLEREGTIPQREALRIIRDAARALAAAHDKNIVHRDVKPSNIMLAESGEVKLSDLGLAKDLSAVDLSLTHSGAGMGSPNYIAPEQVRDAKTADQRADIYSLGATFYHMVAGRVPHEGRSAPEVMLKHVTDEPEDAHRANPAVSPAVADLIRRMMTKDPDARIGGMRAVAEEADELLRKIDAGEPLKAPQRAPHRFRPQWVALALATLAVILVLGLITWLSREPKPGPTPASEAITSAAQEEEAVESAEPVVLTPEPVELLPIPEPEPEPTRVAPVPVASEGANVTFAAPPLPAKLTAHTSRTAPARLQGLAADGDVLFMATPTGAISYDTRDDRWETHDVPPEKLGDRRPYLYDAAVDSHGNAWFAGQGYIARRSGTEWRIFGEPAEHDMALCRLGVGGPGEVCAVGSQAILAVKGNDVRHIPLGRDMGQALATASGSDRVLFALMRNGLVVATATRAPETVPFPESWQGTPARGWVIGGENKRCLISLAGNANLAGLWHYDGERLSRPGAGEFPDAMLVGPLVKVPGKGVVCLTSGGVVVVEGGARVRKERRGGARFRDMIMRLRAARSMWDSALTDARGNVYALRSGSTALTYLSPGQNREIPAQGDLPEAPTTVCVDSSGTAWVGMRSGLMRREGDVWQAFDLPADAHHVRALAADRHGAVFVLAQLARGDMTLFVVRDGRCHGPFGRVACDAPRLVVDKEGDPWAFGVNASGVWRFADNTWRQWTAADGLVSNTGRLAADPRGGVVWVPHNVPKVQRFIDEEWTTQEVVAGAGYLPDGVAVLPDGRILAWLGEKASVLVIDGGRVVRVATDEKSHARHASTLGFDREGRFWIGFKGTGLVSFDGRNDRLFGTREGLADTHVVDLAFGLETSIWVATQTGVTEFVW